ncbi:hypothetical protein VCR15J2_390023 [Vibrio coralliirubri]|uniref:Gp49 family protein n=1 Tax=Vibrio coralliirubri TaxID=1516159 RepID=UPI00062EACCD|nr:Gp49 family protein [Vibrio coralliirubri]CDT52796.1 hypothetical protein VCR15J2_390023 [Vibrio coralliirubri]
MKKFYSKLRIVEALEIKSIEELGGSLIATLEDGQNKVLSSEMVSRYLPIKGDYYVSSEEGYCYVNPKSVFESHYDSVEEFKKDQITADQLYFMVAEKHFAVVHGTTIAVVTLNNGHKVVGESHCINIEDYNQDVGESIAFEDAMSKVGDLEAYHRSAEAFAIECAALDFSEGKKDA